MPETYAFNYMAVALAAVVGFAAMGLMFLVNTLVAPRRRMTSEDVPFECGIPPAPFSWSQIHIRYYIFAILFLIFDVEAVFLFPWVIVFAETAKSFPVVFYEMMIFIAILLFGLVYSWRKGVLRWQ